MRSVNIQGSMVGGTIITGDNGYTMELNELAKRLDKMKEYKQNYRAGAGERLRKELEALEKLLAPYDLGIQWDDKDEMYVVYSFSSRKD